MRVGALLGWVAACQCIMTPTVSPLNAPTGSPTMSPWTMAPTGSPMTVTRPTGPGCWKPWGVCLGGKPTGPYVGHIQSTSGKLYQIRNGYCWNKDTEACEAVQESECLPKAQNGQGPDREWCAEKSFTGCVALGLCQDSGVVLDARNSCYEETNISVIPYVPLKKPFCSMKTKEECRRRPGGKKGGNNNNQWCKMTATPPSVVVTEPPTAAATEPPTAAATEPPTAAATEPPSAAATEPPSNSTFSGCDPARPDVCMVKGNEMPSRYRCYHVKRNGTGECLDKSAQECAGHPSLVYCGAPVTDPPSATPPSPARPPAYCSARDWGGCSPTKCCASANFECVKMNRWYGQCRPLGDCPKGWRCNKVKSMTRGEACGCEGYRGDGVTSSSPVLCKLHKAVDGKRYCDAPSSLGECEARTYSACGERVRWRVLVKAAKSDIFGGNLSKALTKAMRIEARQLVMEWICPDALCQPECPTTKQLKTLRGCLKMVNDGQIRSRTATGLSEEKAEKFFVSGTLSEDVTREFEEEKMSELGRQIDLISGGMSYDEAADDLAAFIVRGGESVLEVSAEPIEDSPFGMGTEAGGSSDGGDGSVPLGAVIGSIVGALALCAGVGVFLTRRRAQKSSFEGLRGSTERDDIVDMQSLASAYTSKLPDSGKARSGLSEL